MKQLLVVLLVGIASTTLAQTKQPLTHQVYDGWKSVGERQISNDGKYVVYAVNPQEGDGELVIQQPATRTKKVIARGYAAVITDDSRFVVCKIKPVFQVVRQAKIKKKKADDMPKDSLCIIDLSTDSVQYIARVKSFKTPEKAGGWLAYHLEKPLPDTTKKKTVVDQDKINRDLLVKMADSILRKAIDSVKGKVPEATLKTIAEKAAKSIYKSAIDELAADAEGDDAGPSGNGTDGTELVLRNLNTGTTVSFKLATEYLFDKKGTSLLVETSRNAKDTNSKAYVLLRDLVKNQTDTLMRRFNESKAYTFDEAGLQLAFVAERDSSEKALQKFYKLWYYTKGKDSAQMVADKNTVGIQLGYTISENANYGFSKNGQKLFLGVAPIKAPKDTTLVDFELARLDVWNYKDDYLQPQQLKLLETELKRSYVAVWYPASGKLVQLGDTTAENVSWVDEGNADILLATSTKGNRIQSQWTGHQYFSGYIINALDGSKKKFIDHCLGNIEMSPKGKFAYWYDPVKQHYFTYEVATGITRNISAKIKVPLYDTENDVPDYPGEEGDAG